MTVLLESFRPDVKGINDGPASAASSSSNKRASAVAAAAPLAGFEHMECSTKSLLLLMKYRGPHMKVSSCVFCLISVGLFL